MFDKIFKVISIIIIAIAIGVFTYIMPLAKEDIQQKLSEQKTSTFNYDKYQIITQPKPSDIVYITTMVAGTIIVASGTSVLVKEYC